MDGDWEAALRAVLDHRAGEGGIGTLQERTLHAALKQWMAPDPTHREVALEGLVADVFDGQRVTEIQTRNLYALKSKLDRLLPHYPVMVVHPLAHRKTLVWVDPDTGAATKPRRSPKTGRFWDAFHELYSLRPYLNDPHLTIRLVLLDMEEYRLQDGWGRGGKRGSHRVERLPGTLYSTADLHTSADYAALIPDDWGAAFTCADVAAHLRVRRRLAGEIINVLYTVGAIQRLGKNRNAFVYARCL